MSQTLKGILLMLAAMAVFVFLDSTAKLVMQTLDTFTAVFFRYAIALALTCVLIWRTGGLSLLHTRHPWLQVTRGALLVVSTWFNFIALRHLELATSAAIFFTVPLLVCGLSALLLGEHVGPRRWLAVAIGLLGVLVIMRPGTMAFHWAMLSSLAAAFCSALYNITTRKVGSHDRAETSLFFVGLFGSIGSLAPLPWHWQMPQGSEWLMLLIMGTAGVGGHFLLIQAHRLASAATLAPYIYTEIIWMTIAGIILFSHYPDRWTIAGAAIVIACGIYVWHRERAHALRETAVEINP
ncbi:MAG: DMT family transporter [Proteobacteria bacterium]|nr:DMT family transporter [Pseudomonadota bacterium]